jgi:predicted transcriptional regulator
MTVQEIVAGLDLEVVAGGTGLGREVKGGYACDLMSLVLVRSREGDAWVTMNAHPNVVAIANLRDLACVIIAERPRPDEMTLIGADEKGIPVLVSDEPTFTVCRKLGEMGVDGTRSE